MQLVHKLALPSFAVYDRSVLWNRVAITNVTFPSGNLILEGRLSMPQGQRLLLGVVLCHPHPLHGGSMDNNVMEGIITALEDQQIAVLVFNFRGVGRSQGTHDHGIGEVDDALAAARFLAGQPSVDRDRIGIAGYSFGAVVALNTAARDEGFGAVALVACPTLSLDNPELHQIGRPKLFIHGDRDNVVQIDKFNSLILRFQQPTEVETIPGADHFLQGYEPMVGNRVAEFFARALG